MPGYASGTQTQTQLSCLRFAVFPAAAPLLFWLIVKTFEKTFILKKESDFFKKEIKEEERSCVPS